MPFEKKQTDLDILELLQLDRDAGCVSGRLSMLSQRGTAAKDEIEGLLSTNQTNHLDFSETALHWHMIERNRAKFTNLIHLVEWYRRGRERRLSA